MSDNTRLLREEIKTLLLIFALGCYNVDIV